MSRDRFLELAGQMYDLLATGATSAPVGNGSGAQPPKYDTSISRKGGMVQYASETDAAGLAFWKARAEEPPKDVKYAESNAKQAKALGYWLAYRQAEPAAIWTGERNREVVTAKAPSPKPETYPRGVPTSAMSTPAPAPSFDDAADDSDIPFILNVSCDETERWHRPL